MRRLSLLLCLLLPVGAMPLTGMAAPVVKAAPTVQAAPAWAELLRPVVEDALVRDATVGLHVMDVASGEEVFSMGGDVPMNPASTTKLLTAAASLRSLGPAYRFDTTVLAESRPDADGRLGGGLYIKGGGDPSMVIERLWKLAQDLRLDGVKEIAGDVVLDDTLFEGSSELVGWDKARDVEGGPAYFPRLSALSLNFNTVAVVVRPGSKVGSVAQAEFETPAGDVLKLENHLVTKVGRARVDLEREVTPTQTIFKLTGQVPPDAEPMRFYRTVGDPTAYFGAALLELLGKEGITVKGAVKRGITPAGAVVLREHSSVPLTNVLMDMNKFSNNFMAEQILRVSAAAQKQGPASHADGVAVLESYLASIGAGGEGTHLVNASGLAREGRVRPSDLTAVLVDMARDYRVGGEFASSLAIAGTDGTLSRRLREEAGRVRGKTGTLDGVYCLAGYIEGGDSRRYAFAFLVNDYEGGPTKAKSLQDSFAKLILGSGDGAGAVTE